MTLIIKTPPAITVHRDATKRGQEWHKYWQKENSTDLIATIYRTHATRLSRDKSVRALWFHSFAITWHLPKIMSGVMWLIIDNIVFFNNVFWIILKRSLTDVGDTIASNIVFCKCSIDGSLLIVYCLVKYTFDFIVGKYCPNRRLCNTLSNKLYNIILTT